MLVFVVPLRNKSTTNNWESCWRHCEQTLLSAANQGEASARVRVVLACQDADPLFSHDRIDVVSQTFPDPGPTHQKRCQDKYEKIKLALVHVRRHYAPCYVMRLDADDLVSNRLGAYVLADDNRHGYFMEHGYQWISQSHWLQKEDRFHLVTGSSNILYATPDQLPDSMDRPSHVYDLLALGHNITVETFVQRGAPLAEIPFPAALKRSQTGENISAQGDSMDSPPTRPNWKFHAGKPLRYLRQALRTRWLGASLQREFSLTTQG